MPGKRKKHKARLLLGDVVQSALSSVGITEDLVHSWLGVRCRCKERRDKLNRLDLWARSFLNGDSSYDDIINEVTQESNDGDEHTEAEDGG